MERDRKAVSYTHLDVYKRQTARAVPNVSDILISIHALRMERDKAESAIVSTSRISIHALRMERDYAPIPANTFDGISIHALRMERDPRPSPLCW